MRTRSGICYPRPSPAKRGFDGDGGEPRKRARFTENGGESRKRARFSENGGESRKRARFTENGGEPRKRARFTENTIDFFNGLPDDLVILMLSKLSASADSPSDLFNVQLTCRRLNQLSTHESVLSKISAKGTAVKAENWNESAHRFLIRCAEAGSMEACYTLGMMYFYCLQDRELGIFLIAKAAMESHLQALHSLAVINFNGSGGYEDDMDLHSGISCCCIAASRGHIDALRELGHCRKDGYGVRRNVSEGRRLLFLANKREAESFAAANGGEPIKISNFALQGDFGIDVSPTDWHPANRFMAEWFAARGVPAAEAEGERLKMCSHGGCGRPETRPNEFRHCSSCASVNYCSRSCQTADWRLGHRQECAPMARRLIRGVAERN